MKQTFEVEGQTSLEDLFPTDHTKDNAYERMKAADRRQISKALDVLLKKIDQELELRDIPFAISDERAEGMAFIREMVADYAEGFRD